MPADPVTEGAGPSVDTPAVDPKDAIVEAALIHVPFDGWSEATLTAAAADAGVSPDLVRALFPRGAVDLALAYHRQGDAAMVAALQAMDLSAMPFRDRVKTAIRLRLEHADKEAVRRGATLFALPQNAGAGSKAVWGSADAIWTALGDTSEDFNWYSKRATLSAVYSATVLYWLGDDSLGAEDTWAFLDRRIEGVMRIESVKAQVNKSPLGKLAMAGPNALMKLVRAPGARQSDLPGSTG